MENKIAGSIVFALMLFSFSRSSAQSFLSFSYDASGNRIKREITSTFQKRDTLSKNDTVPQLDTALQSPLNNILPQTTEGEVKLISGTISVYPNPVMSSLNIDIKGVDNTPFQAILFDLKGNILQTKEYEESRVEFDVSQLNTAMYFLEIRTNKEKIVWKIIKQ